jgi:L-arabinonolactonase
VALDTLYITSARIDLDAAALADDPAAGGVFIARPGRRGLPEPVFQGSPV